MIPSAFRALPRHDQIEMMAHRREKSLRDSHAAHVQRILTEKAKDDKPPPKPGR